MKSQSIRFSRVTRIILLPLLLLLFIVFQAYGATPGKRLWVRRYNGPDNGYDWANAIAVDSSGNVYITGSSIGSGTGQDYATIKYDSAGNKKWVRRYNGPDNGYDWANAIAVDASGNVYVTGYSTGSGTSKDYATIKYDSTGKKSGSSATTGQQVARIKPGPSPSTPVATSMLLVVALAPALPMTTPPSNTTPPGIKSGSNATMAQGIPMT